jgi:hypothetical protein
MALQFCAIHRFTALGAQCVSTAVLSILMIHAKQQCSRKWGSPHYAMFRVDSGKEEKDKCLGAGTNEKRMITFPMSKRAFQAKRHDIRPNTTASGPSRRCTKFN